MYEKTDLVSNSSFRKQNSYFEELEVLHKKREWEEEKKEKEVQKQMLEKERKEIIYKKREKEKEDFYRRLKESEKKFSDAQNNLEQVVQRQQLANSKKVSFDNIVSTKVVVSLYWEKAYNYFPGYSYRAGWSGCGEEEEKCKRGSGWNEAKRKRGEGISWEGTTIKRRRGNAQEGGHGTAIKK